MDSDKKAFIGIVIVCLVLIFGFFGLSTYYKNGMDNAYKLYWQSEIAQINAEIRVDSMRVRNNDVKSIWKMWTQDAKQGYAFAELFKVNDKWFLSTNLPVNREELFYVLKVCQDSSIDIPEMMQNIWRESRIGCNLQHKLNYDGSIDGGWFGLNSRYHPIKTLGDPKKDIYLYIAFLRKNLDPYPDHERYYRYVYGSAKAKELGYIK